MNGKYVEWEITGKCNLSCAHCRNPSGARGKEGPSKADCDEIVDALVDAGCESVTLSGGEPLLCEHWHSTAHRMARRGVSVQMVTNGWLLDETAAAKARDAGVSLVFMSLDGPPKEHDLIRGQAGSYRRVMKAARHLEDRGVSFGFITTVLRSNLHRIEAMVREAEAVPEIWQIWAGIPTHHGWSAGDMWLTRGEIRELRRRVLRLQSERPQVCPGDNLAGGQHLCRAGSNVFGIDAALHVRGCLAMGSSSAVGRIEAAPLEDLFARVRKKLGDPSTACRCMPKAGNAPGTRAFSHAAAALLLSGLAGGCSGSNGGAEPREVEPVVSVVQPAVQPAVQPVVQELSGIPACCLSHMLIPGCVCSWKPFDAVRLGVRMSVPSLAEVERLEGGVVISVDTSLALLNAGRFKLMKSSVVPEDRKSGKKDLRNGAVFYPGGRATRGGDGEEQLYALGWVVVGDRTFTVECSGTIPGKIDEGAAMLPWCEHVLGSLQVVPGEKGESAR